MSELLIHEVTPTAAALVCAVADRDHTEVQRVLEQLDTTHLHALAIVLADHLDPDKPFTPRVVPNSDPVGAALKAAALRWRITTTDITSRSRRREDVDARAVVCYVAHRMGLNFSELGRRLERDHSTIMYACTRVGENARLRAVATSILEELHPPRQESLAS